MSLLGHNLGRGNGAHYTVFSVSSGEKQPLFIWGQLQEVLGPWAEATPPGCNEYVTKIRPHPHS